MDTREKSTPGLGCQAADLCASAPQAAGRSGLSYGRCQLNMLPPMHAPASGPYRVCKLFPVCHGVSREEKLRSRIPGCCLQVGLPLLLPLKGPRLCGLMVLVLEGCNPFRLQGCVHDNSGDTPATSFALPAYLYARTQCSVQSCIATSAVLGG